ncbi:uncharacterized protein [Drosophila kikkawai]|uniref:Iris n=1 Tax=Drosophila kikkawai TaxID=30033 RepID=A0ABM3C802_DROKI|nr:uncharacterized protein LOC121502906 [Drosophila kikkawai]
MTALIWIFFLVALSIGSSKQAQLNQGDDGKVMTLKAFNNSLGTFVEFTGRAAIAMEDWTVYASFDLEQLIRESAFLETGYQSLKTYCETDNVLCIDSLYLQLTEFGDTMSYQGLTERAVPHDFRLKHLPLDDDEIANLLRDKYSVVDSTKNIKGSLKNLLDQLELEIDELLNNHKSNPMSIYYVTDQLSSLAAHIKRSQFALLEALTSANQRKLTPLILSVQQLETEILRIQPHIPAGRRLPVNQSTVSDVYRIASVSVQQLDKNHLVFEIKVPLIDAELFSLYRLTPIPRVQNGQIEVMDTETPYLAINNHQDRFFPLQNLGDCIELARERLICRHIQVTFGNGGFQNIPCGLAAIRNQSSGACQFRKVEKSSLWTQLLAPNSWMVALSQELSLTAVCSEDRQELDIRGSGILSIRSDCIVRSSAVILQGRPHQRGSSKIGFASLQSKTNTADHVSIQAALHQLQMRLDQQKMQGVGGTLIAVIAVCPVIGLVIILLSLVWLYRYHRKRQFRGAQNPVNDPEYDISRPQVKTNESKDGNLPLLEKSV